MRFSFEVGDTEKLRVEVIRSPWIGTMRIMLDGRTAALADPTNLSTHFNRVWVRRYALVVGMTERHEIIIEHERPFFMGGLRPNTYRIFVDAVQVEEYHGY